MWVNITCCWKQWGSPRRLTIQGGSSHVRTVWSSLPLTARSPLTAQQYTQAVWPISVATTVPLLQMSHSLRVWSLLAVSTRRGEGKGSAKTAWLAMPPCPWRVSSGLPVRRSQKIAVPSHEPERTYKGTASECEWEGRTEWPPPPLSILCRRPRANCRT